MLMNKKNDSTAIIQMVCAILFLFIIFHYLYSFQGDILGMMQYSWSDHQTRYNRLIGGVIITLVTCIVAWLTAMVVKLPQRVKALVYLPAMFMLGTLTAVDIDAAGHVSTSATALVLMALVFIFFPLLCRKLNSIAVLHSSQRDGSTLVTPWWTNLLCVVIMTVMMYSVGNTDRTLHTRLAVERLCHEGKYQEALATGIAKHDNDMSLTMWRAYALAMSSDGRDGNQLGYHLFNYNILGKTPSLLPCQGREPSAALRDPYPVWQCIGFVPRIINEAPERYLAREERRHTARRPAADFLLCTYLIKKDLKAFAETLPQYYDSKAPLPKHYAEALCICQDTNMTIDDAVRADYHDFLSLLRVRKPLLQKQADIRDNYFGTYWYYYYRK